MSLMRMYALHEGSASVLCLLRDYPLTKTILKIQEMDENNITPTIIEGVSILKLNE